MWPVWTFYNYSQSHRVCALCHAVVRPHGSNLYEPSFEVLTALHVGVSPLSAAIHRFITLADAIEAAFPGVVVEGNAEGDGRSGSFEIKSATGEVLFSRLESGAWPQEVAIVEALQAGAGACELTEAKQ